mmetsp:Transcript_12688/g.27846  ORF Transcript_12688/g.27846 Transcript_12688/m.27846 type:complete len:230 (-) Transcript_12688:64-753(-)|eukprot:CAMPEP_0206499518 /NCGR_PEP_ID=MMETSP0324_2-20121206/51779_1 /ASSEMBLY_ACC=CAM_ASM_000836 /TAXON_ID=2866 /ORGANISM="Crypthecodinium cohnii, Strain Seligo" /LENGTH=229 /DNA_ID=CAMNT_0053986195 /DNA_START=79 /DNA_END=768 /DNA_ORIENTATION=-
MDIVVLEPLLAQVKQVEQVVLDAKAGGTPEVLVKPSLEKLEAAKEDLAAVLKTHQNSRFPDVAFNKLKEKVSSTQKLLRLLEEQLQEAPWLEPPKMRRARQTGTAIASAIADLRNMANAEAKVVATSGSLNSTSSRPLSYAPAMLAGTSAGPLAQRAEGDRPGMDVDEALALLLDRKTSGYRGGLIGIVHAAGVQEMIPIPNHSPNKFEFVFAPKSGAAFNLHQFSCMI